MVEQRRYERAQLHVPVEFARKGGNERVRGRATNISLGGMFVETDQPLAFSTEVTVYMTLPASKTMMAIPAVVRWIRDDGMGVQFGLIGARETHAITALTLSK